MYLYKIASRKSTDVQSADYPLTCNTKKNVRPSLSVSEIQQNCTHFVTRISLCRCEAGNAVI